jgi:hypothetical protein
MVDASCPDNMENREGAQSGKLLYALSNTTLAAASRSMYGA